MAGQQHHSFVVDNVRVFFPFQPYPTQVDYVRGVIRALNTKQNAMLESPTGTGKTLSLLCSSLAWLQSQPGAKTIIYYTSRTHIQLRQAANEMKRTAYAKVPSVVIGSRSQMCLNDEVKHQAGDHLINRACRNAIAKNACSYHLNYEKKLEVMHMESVHDIEDLLQFGRTQQCCPYYASKKIAEAKASLIFMPYNYLLDTSLKKSVQMKLENSVIIFDEAHNIEDVLKDAVSGLFTQSCLDSIRDSCLKLPEKLSEALNREKHGLTRSGYDPKNKRSAIVDEFKQANGKPEKEVKVNPIEELAEKLTNDKLQQVNRCAELLRKETKNNLELDKATGIDKVLNLLKLAGIHYQTSDQIITTLDSMASFWSIAGVMSPTMVARFVSAISNLCKAISLLYPCDNLSLIRQNEHEKKLREYYTAFLRGIHDTSPVLTKGALKDWELNLWCLHPSLGLDRVIDSNCINGPRSLIVTSGTLAPMLPLEKDLGVKFSIQKELKHVIGPNQLKMIILSESPNSYSLASDFKSTEKEKYPHELGKTFLPLFKILPFGTLVFFQSYGLMNKVVKYWKRTSFWRDMSAITSCFIESKTQTSFQADIESYKKKVASSGRAIFFGVCRGKLSEGVNLEGDQCRTVILTGLPYANVGDPKVNSTRDFHSRHGDPKGERWYSQQMLRALNQTIGRVIRSKNDFGLLVLCGPRFLALKMNLSEWAREFFPKQPARMDVVDRDVKQFFHEHGVSIKESATESMGAFEMGFQSSYNSLSSLSSFSEESSKASDPSSSKSSSSVRSGSPERLSQREAMISMYKVDPKTYQEVQKNRLKLIAESEEPSTKRAKTTTEVFSSICGPQPAQQPTENDAPCTSSPKPNTATTNVVKKSSLNIFKKRKTKKIEPKTTTQSTDPLTISSQITNTTHDYSILNQFRDKDRPASYKCCICLREAENPHRTNCTCARVGCLACIRVLNKTNCGKCNHLLEMKNFRQLLFKSAFYSRDRQPMVMVPASRKNAKKHVPDPLSGRSAEAT